MNTDFFPFLNTVSALTVALYLNKIIQTFNPVTPLAQSSDLIKGGLISESFSLWHNSQKKVLNHSPEHLLFS